MRKPGWMEVVRSYYEEVVLEHTQSPFNEYLEIAVSEGKLVLNSRNANYSYGNLQKVFEEALFQLQIRRRNVNSCLVLGLGAGSVVKSLRDKFRIKAPVDGVELDPEVIRLGKEWFGLGEIEGLSVFNMDANEFLEKNAKKYDLYAGAILISNDQPLDNLDGNLTKFKILTKSITGSPTFDFDNFIIKNDFIKLSTALTSFKAQSVETHKVALSWETAMEINSDYFVLERSRDSINYIQISKIKAAGESSNKITYQFVDETPSFGTNYYRLKLIETDKKEQVFIPQSVVISDANVPFGVFPNPVITPEFYVKVKNTEESELSLFDINGRNIAFEKNTITDNILKVIPSEGLNLGMYVLKVKNAGSVKEHKVIVFK